MAACTDLRGGCTPSYFAGVLSTRNRQRPPSTLLALSALHAQPRSPCSEAARDPGRHPRVGFVVLNARRGANIHTPPRPVPGHCRHQRSSAEQLPQRLGRRGVLSAGWLSVGQPAADFCCQPCRLSAFSSTHVCALRAYRRIPRAQRTHGARAMRAPCVTRSKGAVFCKFILPCQNTFVSLHPETEHECHDGMIMNPRFLNQQWQNTMVAQYW